MALQRAKACAQPWGPLAWGTDNICPGLWVDDLPSHVTLEIEILPLSFKYGFMVGRQGLSAQKSRSTGSPRVSSQPSGLHIPSFVHLPPCS